MYPHIEPHKGLFFYGGQLRKVSKGEGDLFRLRRSVKMVPMVCLRIFANSPPAAAF